MDTTHTMNAGLAAGLASETTETKPASAESRSTTVTTRRKHLAFAALAVAGSAAVVLCFKAAVVISYVLNTLDNVYNSGCS